jgi:multimeric flavodoxin WrbA
MNHADSSNRDLTRRGFLGATGAALAAGAAAQAASADEANATPDKIKILAVCGSPREESSTAASLRMALQAAEEVAPDRVETELVELAGMSLPVEPAVGIPLPEGRTDDFPQLIPKLSDPKLAGLIVGSPVYFGCMTSLCKVFLERLVIFRKDDFALANKVAGAVAVGGGRNGGQELTLRAIQTCLFGQQMIVVGDAAPTAHWGGTVWNNAKANEGDVTWDEFGMETTRNLGKHVAEVALKLAGKAH